MKGALIKEKIEFVNRYKELSKKITYEDWATFIQLNIELIKCNSIIDNTPIPSLRHDYYIQQKITLDTLIDEIEKQYKDAPYLSYKRDDEHPNDTLTTTEQRIIEVLSGNDGLTATKISNEMGVSQYDITYHLNRLIERGIIEYAYGSINEHTGLLAKAWKLSEGVSV